MSDIPPELLEVKKPAPKLKAFAKSSFWSEWGLLIVLGLALLCLWPFTSYAATLDMTDVYCELFEPGLDGRYYIAADPPYTADCPHPWVTLRVDKFKSLVNAFEGGTSPSTPSQFTADEVAALKYQAANPSPFNLSIADGALISASIAAVWALAWGFKQLGRFFNDGPFESES